MGWMGGIGSRIGPRMPGDLWSKRGGRPAPEVVPVVPSGGPSELTLFGLWFDLSPLPQETFEGWAGSFVYPSPQPNGRIPVDRPGSLGAIRANVGLNSQGVPSTFELLVNGAPTAPPLVITVPPGATGIFSQDASAVSLVAGDTLSVRGSAIHPPIGQTRGTYDVEFIPD